MRIEAAGRTKYQPLARWLREYDRDHVSLSFQSIEEIIGAALPPSARYDALWRGKTIGRPGGAIADAGWRVEAIDHSRQSITLSRAASSLRSASSPSVPSAPSKVVRTINATLEVARMDAGPRLVVERAELLSWLFFTTDSSSVGPNAYDGRTGRGERNRITTEDIAAINTTMRARSPHTAWASLTGAVEELPWLVAIPPDMNLFTMANEEWAAVKLTVEQALTSTIGPYRQASVATKVLHLKRPRLFPVLDSLVAEQVGGVGRPAMALLEHVRTIGRMNLDSLTRIAAALKTVDIDRTEVRILDVLLWTSHPAAGLSGRLAQWEHRFRPTPNQS